MGFREREPAALLLAGIEDDRLRDRRAARLRAAGARGGADRLRLAVHEDRARLRGMARAGPPLRVAAGLPRGSGGGLLASGTRLRRGQGLLPPGEAGHDREVARDREPG